MLERLKKSLFLQLIVLTVFMMAMLLTAFIVTNQYIERTIRENTLEASNKFLDQVAGQAEEYYDSVNHVATTMAYSPTVYSYFTMDAVDRVLAMENVSSVFLNTVLLEKDISEIYLYDMSMNRIASMGKERSETDEMQFIHVLKKKIEFSNIFYLQQSKAPYYVIYFPVFDLDSVTYGEQIGMCVLVMKTNNFTRYLEHAPVTGKSQVYLVDGSDKIMASVGGMESGRLERSKMESSSEYSVQVKPLKMDGWRVVSRISLSDLSGKMNSQYSFIVLAYGMAFAVLAGLLYFSYKNLVLPLRQVDNFIQNIVAEPKNRLIPRKENEIGTVVRNLNTMLDEKEQAAGEIQEAQRKRYEAELAKKQLQVLAYRNQINPHFLYNTFECIRSMALYYDADDIAEITMALANVFRFAVKGDNIVSVEEEAAYIREYAKIIHYRFMDRIKVITDMEEGVKEKKVIKLILQPLVENAVFHGLEQTIQGGEVYVRIRQLENDKLLFIVEDNGCGIDPQKLQGIREGLERQENQKGIGMPNIYQRLFLFYEGEVSFTIESELDRGTKITIIVPNKVKTQGGENV
ncbi:sensor histidine kinase [Lactonifactor longoviformis]|uniref:Two-component system, sensor histidine kinase YesM n=1 Tax=Lactonifactor longoviformis DSM 17459 TaxID=1122155 RepID=A0A1M5BCM4_9CLOT|nr:sensor histidine kinase [Lactonifactor longoviformis]POP30894.1 sensor histidine kinase [Lactonifactor longoviformis]SHF40274.1 two-component system, sensor histidine kinase YesM [Lactonifactor longoviformis DSM 17459]